MQGSPFGGPSSLTAKPFKVLSVIEDDAYVIKTQCCTIEMYILHPQNYMVVWSNSTTVYGMQKKDTGATVFNISPIEPMLDCYLNSFIIKIIYKIDQGEIKEIVAACDLLDHKTRIGNNVFQFEQNNEKLVMSFTYLGYNEEKEAFGLQNLCFTLFIKDHGRRNESSFYPNLSSSKVKVQRAPTNRAMSTKVSTYQSSLLSKLPNQQMNLPYGMNPDKQAFVPKTLSSSKVLKLSANAYKPPGKISSSTSVATYRSMPVGISEKTDPERKLLFESWERLIIQDKSSEISPARYIIWAYHL